VILSLKLDTCMQSGHVSSYNTLSTLSLDALKKGEKSDLNMTLSLDLETGCFDERSSCLCQQDCLEP